MELYIVRHGQTEWNKERRLQGSADIMLAKEGVEAAKKTGTALKNVAFDKIYSSPLTRAYDTACYIRADRNIEIVKLILQRLGKPESLIEHVEDRKGHDYRYAIDPTKIKNELGWYPKTKFEDGIVKTIDWYLENPDWLK